jgi:hypothetical protein
MEPLHEPAAIRIPGSVVSVLAVMLLVACNAPHDNPLDPALGGNLEGRILNRRATGIAGAVIALPEEGRFCHTDSSGDFVLSGLPEGTFVLSIDAHGYAPETAAMEFRKGRIDTLTRYLNGLPYFTDCRVTSHVYGQGWPPEPLYFFRLTASAADIDGDADIDSVWAELPELEISERLTFDPEEEHFSATLWSNSVPGQNPETMVGQNVEFNVVDNEGAMGIGPECSLSRIIYELPTAVFPAGGVDTVRTDTTLVWNRFRPGFLVTYKGEVVRIEGGGSAGVVLSFETGEPTDTTFWLDASKLPTGDYYWTIEAIDGFGNSSRSQEERFHAD